MKKKVTKFFESISNAICPICGGELIAKKRPDKIKKKFLIFTYYKYILPDHDIICIKNGCMLIHPTKGYEVKSIQCIQSPRDKKLKKAYSKYYSGCDEDVCMM